MTDTNPHPSPQPGPTPPPRDTPTGYHVRSDRPCARCGFNLHDQPVVREPHYRLLAARCPECGQLAALQEYPALGRWADRWARVLAAAWIVALVAAAAAHFGPTFGMLIAGVEIASENFAAEVAGAFNAWETGQNHAATNTGMASGWHTVKADWWDAHGQELIASRGGVLGVIDRRAAWMMLPLCVGSFAAGAFWSVCLLGARRRSVVIPALVPLGVALLFAWSVRGAARITGSTTIYAHDVATEAVRLTVLSVFGAAATLCLLVAVWQGRRLARVVVRLSLPPRMRSALAILWTRDGLPPPGPDAA